MPISRANTILVIKQEMDNQSDNPATVPAEAREALATAIGNAVFDSMIGREVLVNGVTSDGATFTATGIIQE